MKDNHDTRQGPGNHEISVWYPKHQHSHQLSVWYPHAQDNEEVKTEDQIKGQDGEGQQAGPEEVAEEQVVVNKGMDPVEVLETDNDGEKAVQHIDSIEYPVADEELPEVLEQTGETITAVSDISITTGQQQENEELFAKAVELFELGTQGNKAAVIEAHEILKNMYEKDSENNLVEAYYGSVTALLGRDAADPMAKYKMAVKGLKMLDNAVSKAPENIKIRALRGNISYSLPDNFFHRTDTAIEDFTFLISRYEQDSGTLSPEFYRKILNDLGESYKRLDRIQEYESIRKKLTPLVKDLKDETLQKGIKLHKLALEGDKEEIDKAYSFLKRATETYPDDQLLKAYFADCMSMMAQNSVNLWEMFSFSHKARKAFDSAVSGDPKSIGIRFLRAYHSFRLPEPFFRRTGTAVTDFDYLINRYENDNSVFSQECYWQLLYDLGAAYRRLGLEKEALSVWKKLMSLEPGEKYEAMIEEELDKDFAGFHLYELAVSGNRAAAKMSLELWQKVYEKNPEDAVAQAYYGSSMALVGLESSDLYELLGKTIKGLKYVNRAVEREPDNTQLRVVRVYTAFSLPEIIFRQSKKAVQDLQFLKEAYEQDNSVFSQEFYCKILNDLSVACQRAGSGEMLEGTSGHGVPSPPDTM